MNNSVLRLLILLTISCSNSEITNPSESVLTTTDSAKMNTYIDSAEYYFRQTKELEKARNMYDSAYKYGCSKEVYQYSIGYFYYYEFEFLRASLFFEGAIEENPNVAKCHLRLAECYYFLNEPKDLVKRTLSKGLDLGGEYPQNLPTNLYPKPQ